MDEPKPDEGTTPVKLRVERGLLEAIDQAVAKERERLGVPLSRHAWMLRELERSATRDALAKPFGPADELAATPIADALAAIAALDGVVQRFCGGWGLLYDSEPPFGARVDVWSNQGGERAPTTADDRMVLTSALRHLGQAVTSPERAAEIDREWDELEGAIVVRAPGSNRPAPRRGVSHDAAPASDIPIHTAEVTGSFTTTSTLGAARTPGEVQRQLEERGLVGDGPEPGERWFDDRLLPGLRREAEASVALDGDTHSMSEQEWAAYSAASAREAGHDPEATLGPDSHIDLPEVGDREEFANEVENAPQPVAEMAPRPMVRVVRTNAGPFWRWDAVDENGVVLAGGSCPGKRDVPGQAKERLTALFGHDAFDVKVEG